MASDDFDDDFYDFAPSSSTRKLNEGVVLRDLIENGEAEFSFDLNASEEPEEEKVEEAYRFEEYEGLINLDCIGVDDNTDKLPFEALEEKMTPLTSDRGVMKLIKERGGGIKVPENAFVYMHYSCFLEFQEVPYDSSFLRSTKPVKFQVGQGKLFPGLDIGVCSMHEGEKSYILVKPEYAFGKMGVPPRIPNDATILVEVHLMKVVDCGAVVEEDEFASESSRRTLSSVKKKAMSFMELGKDCFSQKNYGSAADSYRKAVALLNSCELMNDEEEAVYLKLVMKAYTNLTICYNGLQQHKRVCFIASEAAAVNFDSCRCNAKLQYNWGKALKFMGEYKKAADHVKFAKKIEPNNLEIDKLLKEIEDLRKEHFAKEKIMFQRGLNLTSASTPPQSKSSDILPEDSGYLEQMRGELKKFSVSKNSRFELPKALIPEEIKAVRQICDELGLTFKEFKIADDIKMAILK